MSLFTKKAYVGLDIGHHTLRAVQVERTVSGWRIAKSASAPTPEDTVRDGVVIDAPILGLAIKQLLKSAHISATSASIAISGGTVVVRPIRLPKMAESALRKSIRFEASRYVPNSVEDSYIEFEIIGDVDATNMDVIIAAAPKELVDSRVSACESAGLEVENVEVATFAAYRSIIEADHGHEWAEKTVGLVDIGASVTNLGVISKGGFSMTRAIPAGGQVLTDALKSYFKLSTEDAESGKGQLDIRGLLNEASVAENPPLRILHTHIDDLVREVRRSINYWQSQQNEAASAKHVDVIVLCGGGSNLPGIAEYFQHKLGIETLALGVFDNARFIATPTELGRGLDMAVAVGLAMGLAPSSAVVRDPKPVVEKPAKAAAPPKPPREPKPTKPPKPPKLSKGRTFKVSRPVGAPEAEVETGVSTESVEIAASLPPEEIAPITPETVPLVAKADAPEVLATTPEVDQSENPSILMPVIEEVALPRFEAPTAEANIEDKYGPELAALIGAFDEEPPTVLTSASSIEETPESSELEEIVQPRSASQRMAGGAGAPQPSTPAKEEVDAHSNEFEVAVPAIEATKESRASAPLTEEPIEVTAETAQVAAATPVRPAVPEPVPAAFLGADVTESDAVRAALIGDSFGPVSMDAVKADRSNKERKPLFSVGKRDAKPAREVQKPVAEKKEEKPKEKKSLFARKAKAEAPKADKPSRPAAPQPVNETEEAAGPLKKAAAWLFGGAPKQHVKPTGVLTPPAHSAGNLGTVASRDPQIELLRGSSLEPVDTTAIENQVPEEPIAPPVPQLVAEGEEPKAKPRKSPAAKKPRTLDAETHSNKEAA